MLSPPWLKEFNQVLDKPQFIKHVARDQDFISLFVDTSIPKGDYLKASLVVKNPHANAEDLRAAGSILGSGRSLGGRNGNSLHILSRLHGQRSLAGYSPWCFLYKGLDRTEAI